MYHICIDKLFKMLKSSHLKLNSLNTVNMYKYLHFVNVDFKNHNTHLTPCLTNITCGNSCACVTTFKFLISNILLSLIFFNYYYLFLLFPLLKLFVLFKCFLLCGLFTINLVWFTFGDYNSVSCFIRACFRGLLYKKTRFS